ncbi:2,3-diaminopropionate biosynthesis protein SbnA [Amycolatopsis samaneae]|uniref:N-(2-amino-2-carboxyethyl)-L-glutamate synthase n=1 Tax=Amycolatopsis samaneae TaxID=664691 RepID=A0ABW5GP94_9PSEU
MAAHAFDGVLSVIGNTPLVALTRGAPVPGRRFLAKLESFNPGGSIKDRTALAMLRERIRDGSLRRGRSVVVESSSGNLAIGLAQICRYFGIRLICVVDPKTTRQHLATLNAYRAEIEVVAAPDPVTGEYLPARIRRVREIVASTPDAFWPNQYANPLNPAAHQETMREIADALDGRVDYVFCAVSSCGTLRGCAEYIAERGMATRIVAVDALGSAIFGETTPARRLIPGHGAAHRPALFAEGLADEVVHVSDLDCVAACRLLADQEALLVGGSSGAVFAAAAKIAERFPEGTRCVLIFPDAGARYLDTIYSDDWVTAHFGAVPAGDTGRTVASCR